MRDVNRRPNALLIGSDQIGGNRERVRSLSRVRPREIGVRRDGRQYAQSERFRVSDPRPVERHGFARW